MKKKLLLTIVFFGISILIQGCYTILDLPEIDSSDYVSTVYVQDIPYPDPGYTPPYDPAPPVIILPPSNGYDQPVKGTNPPQKDRTNDTGTIRNDGNGRGNTGRDVSFSGGNNSGSNNTSSNTNNSSNVRNSGNGRR